MSLSVGRGCVNSGASSEACCDLGPLTGHPSSAFVSRSFVKYSVHQALWFSLVLNGFRQLLVNIFSPNQTIRRDQTLWSNKKRESWPNWTDTALLMDRSRVHLMLYIYEHGLLQTYFCIKTQWKCDVLQRFCTLKGQKHFVALFFKCKQYSSHLPPTFHR